MSDSEESLDIFQEPEDYYPPEKPHTFETFRLQTGKEISLRLVGHSPLWGHLLWQSGRIISTYLETHASDLNLKEATILELGAGAGLPSLVCAILGAKQAVATDYPEADLVANLSHNITLNASSLPSPLNITAEGYLWGAPVSPLTLHLSNTQSTSTITPSKFSLLILADLLFNHSEHRRLLRTVALSLSRDPNSMALVFFTPYRPWLYEKDMSFFELASGESFTTQNTEEKGASVTKTTTARTEEEERSDADEDSGVGAFMVKKVLETRMDKVMFEEDRGDEELRRTVFGFEMRWKI